MRILLSIALLVGCTIAAAQAQAQKPPPQAKLMTNEQLTELLRAQTAAIRSLSEKIASIEARLEQVEAKIKK